MRSAVVAEACPGFTADGLPAAVGKPSSGLQARQQLVWPVTRVPLSATLTAETH